MSKNDTFYSERIDGDEGNYKRGVTFDYTVGGYVGITGMNDDGRGCDRVLLSPEQAQHLVRFIRSKGKSR